jgi:hypothetical protein
MQSYSFSSIYILGLIFTCLTVNVACDSPCVLNTQCSINELCHKGKCKETCKNYYDCNSGLVCFEGLCLKEPSGFCREYHAGSLMSRSDAGVGGVLCPPLEMGIGVDADGLDEGNTIRPRDQGVDMEVVDMSVGEMGVSEMGVGEMGVSEMGVSEMGVSEMGVSEMGVGEMGLIMDMGRPVSDTAWLYVSNAEIKRTGGVSWIGRGVNIHDTRSCDTCTWVQPNVNEVIRRIDEVVDLWGANLIRLNLESYPTANGRIQYRSLLEDQAYLRDIERIIHHVGSKTNVYVLLSLWRDPSYDSQGWPTEQTQEVLRLLVRSFYDAPQVIFAVSHEPRLNLDGAQDEACWQSMNQAVNAIREEERLLSPYRHLIAVQGTRNGGRDLSYYIEHPITADNGENIVYETHISDGQAQFDSLLVNPSQSLPMIIGSFGPSQREGKQMTQGDAMQLITQAEREQVSWVAWTFHMRCQSSEMILDTSNNGCGVGIPLQPTEWGQAMQSRLQQYRE